MALGRLGLSLSDWRVLTPEEFAEALEADAEKQHEEWERTRMLATLMLQPYAKGRLNPESLLQFPWEKSNDTEAPLSSRAMTKEEHAARAAQLLGNG